MLLGLKAAVAFSLCCALPQVPLAIWLLTVRFTLGQQRCGRWMLHSACCW
jgi:hypothetical protein